MRCEECGASIWRAGDDVPAGRYVRVDDESYRPVVLAAAGQLPASCDGHIAAYRLAWPLCACQASAAGRPVGRQARGYAAAAGAMPAGARVVISVPAAR